jgi:hypothetical protein
MLQQVKIDTTPMEGFAAQFNEILGLETFDKTLQ